MRVVQINVFADREDRAPGVLLDAWTGLTAPAEAAAAAGLDVTVLQAAGAEATLERNGATYGFVREQEPSRLRRRLGLWAYPLPRRLAAAASALDPAVIHFHGLAFPRHVRYLRRALPSAALLAQDQADAPAPWWLRPLARHGLAAADGVLFTARAQADPFVAAGVLGRETSVFEVPESSSDFNPGDVAAAREATGLRGDPCLLWLGHLDRNKDPLMMLEALARTVPRLPDARLWCVYRSAPLLDEVQRRIAGDDRLRERVHLLGERSRTEVELLLRAADFLVQGSHREGSGYAVIEALACGTTPVVTDIPSFRMLTGGGSAGALSPPGDAGAMAASLLDWAGRDRAALRVRARAHFEAELSIAAIGRRLRAAYEVVARERRGRTGAAAAAASTAASAGTVTR